MSRNDDAVAHMVRGSDAVTHLGADDADDDSISLATPRPLEDDDDDPSVPQRETYAEQWYAAKGRTLKALAILTLGLKNDDNTPIFNPSVLPWSSALRPTTLKMTAKASERENKRTSERVNE